MTYRMTLGPQSIDSAPQAARPALESAKAKMGMVPNMYARMANLPALLTAYVQGQEAFRSQGGFTPAEQELVFLVISRENGCDYCMGAHSMIADKVSKLSSDAIRAVREDRPVADARLAALAAFTRAMLLTRGNPGAADARAFLAAGFTELHILAIVLAISVKVLSNYSNHLFQTPLDARFADYAWPAGAGAA